ncbi:Sex-lethal -like protein [Brachionus plicatilis]|uniref:Sex-lethal-like protein n=1 Tax=Brachionus plicatilis TaxID=10195 RepID=A0A3M7SQE4_BRAPC|nr:Sex-lethal -like protein [Brachionus plicatilis]
MSVNVKIDTSGGSSQAHLKSGQNTFNPCNLIVNYLPQSVKEHDFNRIFSNIGPLKSCKLMYDRNTGYSFGYGFVEYANEQDAKTAIETLNGFQIEHKRLKVAYARPNCEETKNTNLYIRNIPAGYDEQQLADLFAKHGQVVQVRILRDQNTAYSRRIGFVIMATKQMAQTAIQNLDNTLAPNGGTEPIFVKYADEDGTKKRQLPAAPQFQNGRNNHNFSFQNQFQQQAANFNMMPGINLGKMKTNRSSGHQNRYNPIGGTNSPINSLMSGGNGSSASGFNAWNMPMNPMQQQGYSNFASQNSLVPQFESLIGGGSGGGGGNSANMVNTPGFPHPNMHMHPSMQQQQHGSNFVNSSRASLLDSVNMDSKLGTSTIYVYGIGAHATEADLFSLFSNCGRIQRVNVIKNPKTGQSKGFGFVVFETFDEANFAVHSMNGFNFNNRSLQVSFKSNEINRINFVSSSPGRDASVVRKFFHKLKS